MYLLFGGIENLINTNLKKNKENYNDDSNGNNNNTGVTIIIITIIIIIYVILFIWTVYALATFNLPQEILVLCIVLLILFGPVIPLILAYVFKIKK